MKNEHVLAFQLCMSWSLCSYCFIVFHTLSSLEQFETLLILIQFDLSKLHAIFGFPVYGFPTQSVLKAKASHLRLPLVLCFFGLFLLYIIPTAFQSGPCVGID